MSKLAVYPGSFDPFTLGHLDVARRAATIFDTVLVAVVHNPSKTPAFSAAERQELIRQVLVEEKLTNVHVKLLGQGLLTDFCKLVGGTVIVKGLRNGSDVSSELPQAFVNRDLSGIETLYLPSDPAQRDHREGRSRRRCGPRRGVPRVRVVHHDPDAWPVLGRQAPDAAHEQRQRATLAPEVGDVELLEGREAHGLLPPGRLEEEL